MNINISRIYYNAICGALGGVLSWAVIGALPLTATNLLAVFLLDAIKGALVGMLVGAMLGIVDGLFFSRSFNRVLRGVGIGAMVGVIGGAIGLVLGEAIFVFLGGGVLPRTLGWGILGLLVGMGEGIANRRPDKRSYGLIGGLLGGLLGGATYERLSILLRGWGYDRESALSIGGVIGLMLIGACIGSLVGIVEDVLRKARFKVLGGLLEGQPITIPPKREVSIGKADKCDIILPGDADIQQLHAKVMQQNDQFTVLSINGPVQINQGGQWQSVSQVVLANGDEVRLGRTRLRFFKE